MQANPLPPETDKIWIKLLFGIVDYILKKADNKQNISWIKSKIDNAENGPRSGTFWNILKKRNSLIYIDLKSTEEKNSFTSNDAKNSYKLIMYAFKTFLEIDLPILDDSAIRLSCDITDKTITVEVDFISYPSEIKSSGIPQLRRKKPPTEDEVYIACYLTKPYLHKLGKLTIEWETKNKKPLRPYSVSLAQFEPNKISKSIEFISVGAIGQVIKSSEKSINFVTLQGNTIDSRKLYFQAVVEIDINNREIIYGTHTSIRGFKDLLPASGCVILLRSNDEEFKKANTFYDNPELLNTTTEDPLTRKIQYAQYYLGNKIINTPKQSNNISDAINISSSWDNLNIISGRYIGTINYKKHDTESLNFKYFILEVKPTGLCSLHFSKEEYTKGIVSKNDNVLSFYFGDPNDNRNDFHFSVLLENQYDISTGTFNGKVPVHDSAYFSSGLVTIRKDKSNDSQSDIFQRLYQENGESINTYSQYQKVIESTSNGFTDKLMIKKLINNYLPVEINYPESLRKMNLHLHYKYFTFRAPKSEKPGRNPIDSFRVEKCDVQFDPDFEGVTITSKVRSYRGKTYYNNKVLFMILNPVNDLTLLDSYLTIQIVLPFNEEASDLDMLFGTAMWKGSENLEAKMITLVKAVKKDIGVDIYRLGTHGEPDTDGIRQMIVEDKKYKGALSYSIGRLNRFVRASSSHHTYEMYRPRDKSNRETYIYAAIYAASMADESMNIKGTNASEALSSYISKAKNYLFEAYMHQYGANIHAGVKIDQLKSSQPDIQIRINEIQLEQNFLKNIFKSIKNEEIRSFAFNLWPYLKNS